MIRVGVIDGDEGEVPNVSTRNLWNLFFCVDDKKTH